MKRVWMLMKYAFAVLMPLLFIACGTPGPGR